MKRYVISKDGIKLCFPIVNIGQFDKRTISKLEREVKQGKLVKYEDYTFPHTKNGYAIATMSKHPKAQPLIESLRSLFSGAWIFVPDAMQRVEHEIIMKLEAIRNESIY